MKIKDELNLDHGTVTVERTINVPVARAYAAYADAAERSSWAAPSDTSVFIYEETDFRVGGRDVARCGPKTNPTIRVEERYVDIVPGQLVVSSGTIRDGGKLLAATITSLEFLPDGKAARLKVTVQVTSFVGKDMIENTKAGNAGSLANMAEFLEQPNS